MTVALSLFGLNRQKFALTIRGNERTLAPELVSCSLKFLSLLWIGSLMTVPGAEIKQRNHCSSRVSKYL